MQIHSCGKRPNNRGEKLAYELPKWRLPVLLLLLCSLLALLPACGGGSASSAVVPGPSPSPSPTAPPGSVQPTYFGLNVNDEAITGQVNWPQFPFGSARLWGIDTTWTDLEPTQGSYNWSALDQWIDAAQSHGLNGFLYTFGKGTPSWISSNPSDPTCTKAGAPVATPGQCDPPSDVDSGDQSFKSFVTAIVQHIAQQYPNVTMAWECINEPDVPDEWTGTTAQTLTMCTDMYNIVKANSSSALVTTPAPVNFTTTSDAVNWMASYLQAGGGNVADVIAFHGYFGPPLTPITPETITSIVQTIDGALTSVASKQVWNTEMGYRDSDLPDPDMEAAFVARVYLLQWSNGISRFYWFQYGATNIGTLTSGSAENEAGTAYGVVLSWMVGSTLTSPCSANGNVWTCNFKTASGAQTQAVWDASQSCSNGVCSTSNYTPSSTYTTYIDLSGKSTSISSGSTVPIGAKPILLQ